MSLESPAYVISADSHSAALFRMVPQSMLHGTGVLGSTDLAVSQNSSPNMSVNVAAGILWVPGNQSSTVGMQAVNAGNQAQYSGLSATFNAQGSYGAYQDATVNLSLASSNPSNPRIDAVCATVQDGFYSGSYNQIILQVVTGTPAASPVPPTIPASSTVLAQVYVGAAITSVTNANITDERPFMSLGPNTVAKLRATGATVLPGETTIVTGAGQTFYLPPSAPRNGTVNSFIGQTSGATTIVGTINCIGTLGLTSFTLVSGRTVDFQYLSGTWYVCGGIATTTVGQALVTWPGSSTQSETLTVNHNLVGQPTFVGAFQYGGSDVFACGIPSVTGTQFEVIAVGLTGVEPASGTQSEISWVAML